MERKGCGMLVSQAVSISVSGRTILDGASFSLASGEVVGLVAPNGHGKTLFMKSLANAHESRCGMVVAHAEVSADGICPTDGDAYRKHVLYLPAGREYLYPQMTVIDHLRLIGASWGTSDDIGHVVDECCIDEMLNLRVHRLSDGMAQQAALAAAYLTGARYLLLDEPMNALDHGHVELHHAILRELAETGRGILLSSHLLDDISRVCDRTLYMKNGSLVEGADLARHLSVEQLYECLYEGEEDERGNS